MLMQSNMNVIEKAERILKFYNVNTKLTPDELSTLSSVVAIAKLAEQTRSRNEKVERLNKEEIERKVKERVDSHKKEIMNLVKNRLVEDVTQGMKGVFLLSLKKENWGAKRAQKLFLDVKNTEQCLEEGRITWDDIFKQVFIEYGIDVRIERIMRTPEEVMKCKRQKKD